MGTKDEFLEALEFFSERSRPGDFLYTRNNQYRMVKLEFEKSDLSEYPPVDILQFDHNKLKLEDNTKTTNDHVGFTLNLYVQTLSKATISKEIPICKFDESH